MSWNTTFYIKFFWQDAYSKVDDNIVNFEKIWEVWNLISSIPQKTLTKYEIFVCDEYFWINIISITKYGKWKIYFKSEIINGIFNENLGEEWKWYKKDNPLTFLKIIIFV